MYPISANNVPEHGPIPVPEFQSAREQSEKILRHFGFRESPFGVTPNPAFLFSSRMHFTALQSMIQSIESNLGFTVLLGDPGMGKTTLLLQLLTQYRDSARTAFIFQTQCKRYELLRYLASELELPVMKRDEVSLHRRLKEMLVDEARAGRKVLIFIDEAQNLQQSSLEAIRLLSDFETARAKLLHIILSGSARLGEMLLTPELSQLAQRISTVCRLEPLTPEEVNSYITYRLRVAGCKVAETLFSPESLVLAAEQSEGVPRVVNSICYRALSLAYSIGERHVSAKLMRQAARDLDLSRSPRAIGLNASDRSPRTEELHGLSSLPEPIASEETHAPLAFTEWNPPPLEAPTEQKIQFRSAADSFKQPPSSQAQKKAIPVAPRKAGTIGDAGRTRRNFAWHTPLLGTLWTNRWIVKSDRSTLALAAIILLALGLWTGWRGLRTKSGAAVPGPAGANAIANSPENQDWNFRLSDMLYSPVAAGTPNPERKPEDGNKNHASIIQTLPQSLLPSKLRPQIAKPIEAAPPVVTLNTAGSPINLLPLVSNSRPLPQPPMPSATAESSSNTKPTDENQASMRHPIKIVQPKYPKLAELRHLEGDVLLELHVNSSGKVETVRTISGNSLLGEAAEEAARQWQYPPSAGNQQPTSMVTWVRVNFKLNPEIRR
ncbi:MAG TPA: TonB family protein [Candidatus Angelobacter sp.]|jgi:TonB family protein